MWLHLLFVVLHVKILVQHCHCCTVLLSVVDEWLIFQSSKSIHSTKYVLMGIMWRAGSLTISELSTTKAAWTQMWVPDGGWCDIEVLPVLVQATSMSRHTAKWRCQWPARGCLWSRPGMVHSVSGWTQGVQVKLWDPLRMRAIPEHVRDVFTTRHYTNTCLPLPLPYPASATDTVKGNNGHSIWCHTSISRGTVMIRWTCRAVIQVMCGVL